MAAHESRLKAGFPPLGPKAGGHAPLAEGTAQYTVSQGAAWSARQPAKPVVETKRAVPSAMVVIDDQGQRWTRLPAAALCQAVATYELRGYTYIVRCRRRSLWAAGELGMCGRCFAAHLDLGEE